MSRHPARAPSRRQLLAGAGSTLAALAVAATGGCAPPLPPSPAAPTRQLPEDRSALERTVAWANWTAYLDEDDNKAHPTLADFTRDSGIAVGYSVEIDDNEAYAARITPRLQATPPQDIHRDLLTLSDWMVNRLIRQQLLAPLELIRMPHAANLLEPLKDASFDPGRRYSLPWQSGYAGIGYHRGKVGRELRAIDDLWAPDLKGKVVVVSELRDTVGLVMQRNGVDIAGPFTAAQLQTGMDEISRRIDDGSIRRVKGNSYVEDLKSGNAVAGLVWSGDMATLRTETGDADWTFVLPESGGIIWSDNLVIPITSTHRRNAMALMDFYYRPEIAARVAAYVGYVCPVQGAQAELAKTDPELANSPLLFPTEQWLREHRVVSFRALTAEEDADYSARWATVVGS